MEAAVLSLHLLLLQDLLLWKEETIRGTQTKMADTSPLLPPGGDHRGSTVSDLASRPDQSLLLEPLSEDPVLWKDVTQQEVDLLLLCGDEKTRDVSQIWLCDGHQIRCLQVPHTDTETT